MKKIKVYYAKVPNMGDMLNKEIIEKIFNYKVVRKNYLFGEISGIGSGLGNYTLEGPLWKRILKRASNIFSPNVYIWGTGFISYKSHDDKLYKKNMKFCALRGELSKKRIEKLLNHNLDNVVLADAGILASLLLEQKIEKKYDIGIIAHYKEKDDPIFDKLRNQYDNSIFIDVQDTPINVITKIASCKHIISSSLHGLIIADSLHIPNVHIIVSNKLLGDGFKFDDYYSAYGLKHNFIDVNKQDAPSIEEIEDMYLINDSMVENKKNEILNSFPFEKGN